MVNEHVGDRLSGYLDGELTQQQRQQVELHLEQCEQCRKLQDELQDIRSRMHGARLSPVGADQWRENMNESGVQLSKGIGWVLLIGAALVLLTIAAAHFLADDSVSGFMKFLISAFYLGWAALFVSVLRQRLIERKSDKYKDVEI
jgi:hypothetical protein